MKILLLLLFLIIIINNIKTYENFDKKTCKNFEEDIKDNCSKICKNYNDKLKFLNENEKTYNNIVNKLNLNLEKKDKCNNCMWCIIDKTSTDIDNNK